MACWKEPQKTMNLKKALVFGFQLAARSCAINQWVVFLAVFTNSTGYICLINSQALSNLVAAVSLFNNEFDSVMLKLFGVILPVSLTAKIYSQPTGHDQSILYFNSSAKGAGNH
jgi:hypothetical protein